MHIETQVKAILDGQIANTASIAALTQAVAALATAVADIPASTGAAPDLTPLTSLLNDVKATSQTIATGVADIQAQLEVDENAPPAP